jgi:PAS domain S-box-containing protein
MRYLESTNILKTKELRRWIEGGKQSIEELAQRPLVRKYTAELRYHDATDSAYLGTKGDLLTNHLKPRLQYGYFIELFLICPVHGIIVASTDAFQEGKFRDNQPYYTEGRKKTHTEGVYYSPSREEATMTISTPVTDGTGNLIGVLAGRMNLDELSEIMSFRGGGSSTEDTYLINRFNFFVTEPRFGKNFALKKAVRSQGVNEALSGRSGVDYYIDYRGVPVIGAYHWIPEFHMGIITEVDQAEAFEPIVRLGWWVAGVVGLISVVVVLAAVFFARSLIFPIHELVRDVREVGTGNLDHIIKTRAQYEIGDLARAFDQMTRDLKKTTVSRNEFLKERDFSDSIINSLPGIFFLCDLDYRFVRWNGILERVAGHSHETISRMKLPDLFSTTDRDRVKQEIHRVVDHGDNYFEMNLPTAEGTPIPYAFNWLAVSIGGQRLLAGAGIDVQERKQAEERLTEALNDLQRSNRELEQFAYVASHDLQEPLRMVSSYTQLLERRYRDKLDQDAKDFIGYAVDGANRMQQLIQDLLRFSRVTTRGEAILPVAASEAAGKALFNLEASIQESGARITVDPLPEVLADRGQLIQLFQNLIGNAIKFHRADRAPEIHVLAERKGKEWQFAVHDKGIGIDAQYFERIFTIFQRLHTRERYPGTGIGLALCKRIVERHNGRIWVKSRPESGSSFYFTLPSVETQKGMNMP